MLKLLLDEPISPDIAEGLRRRLKAASVACLADWKGGSFLGVPDGPILEAAAAEKRTLVTYDRSTIPPLLKAWAEAGRDHCGVIFVDEKTIVPSDVGELIRALQELLQENSRADGTNRVWFLRRSSRGK